MRSLIKFALLALLCLGGVSIAHAQGSGQFGGGAGGGGGSGLPAGCTAGTNPLIQCTQAANGNDTITAVRNTDTSPTGTAFNFLNAAKNATLWKIDVLGNETAQSFQAIGVGAGYFQCSNGNGTLPTLVAGQIQFSCPSGAITNYQILLPTASSTGLWCGTNATNVLTLIFVGTCSLGSTTSEFDYTSALSNAWKWANTTAATSSVNQSSPFLNICGQSWVGGGPANAQDCFTIQNNIPNGANPSNALAFTYGGASTGFPGYTFDKDVAVGAGGSHFVGVGTLANLQIYMNQNGMHLNSGDIINWSNNASFASSGSLDAGISRDTTGILDIGNGTAGDSSGFLRTGGTVVLTSNFTTTSNSLTTISGFSWTFPTTNHNYAFRCQLSYSQATAAATDAFGVQAAATAPTNLMAWMRVSTGLAITGVDATLPLLSTTTATNIGTFTPSAAGAIGTIADIFTADLGGTLEQGAGATTLNIMVLTGNASDALTIYRGSSCSLLP